MRYVKKTPKTIFDPRYGKIVSYLVKIRNMKGFTQRSFETKSGYTKCFITRTELKERRLDFIEIIDYMKHLGLTKKEIKVKLAEWADMFVE